ncbi:MAG: tetratricopeptide repeat protein [Candidatus Latescibacteria bacterium]|nr:tetratricopeptide repeat protein [Candidatus Latescibacterota bacterium]
MANAIINSNPQLVFSYDHNLKLGIYNYYLKDYDQAEKHFSKALKYASDSLNIAHANYWLGKTYLGLNRQDQAISCFNQVQKYHEKPSSDFLFIFGIALYNMEQYEDALSCFLNYQAQTKIDFQPKELPLFIAAAALGKKDYDLSRDIIIKEDLLDKPDFYPLADYVLALNYYLIGDKTGSLNLLRKIVADTLVSDISDNARLISGVIYSERGEISKAVNEFDAVIHSQDEQFKEYAYLSAGIVYYRLQQTLKATERFDSLLSRYPNSSMSDMAFFYKAKIQEQSRKWNTAQKEYRKFIATYPESPLAEQASINLGRLMWQDQNYLELVLFGEDFLRKYPKSQNRAELFYYLTKSCYYLKNYNKAEIYGEQFVREFASSDKVNEIYYLLGQTGIAKEKLSYARRYLSLIHSGDFYAYALKDIGDTYLNQDSFFMAINYYNLAERVSTDTLLDEIRFNRERAYFLQGQYESDGLMLKSYLQKYPNSSKAAKIQYQVGQYYLKQGDYREALHEFNRVYEYAPNQDLLPGLELDRAECYAYTGNINEAISIYLRMINDYPKSPLVHKAIFSLANLYDTSENYDNAIVFYSRLITEAPKAEENEKVYFNLANIYRKLNRFNESAGLLERFILAYPKSNRLEQAYLELADDYMDLGKFNSAEKKINEVLTKLAKSGQVYYKLATIHKIENRPSQAKINFINAYDFYLKEEKIELAAVSLLEAGKSTVIEKKYDEARELFTRCKNLTKDERIRIECERQLQAIAEKKD